MRKWTGILLCISILFLLVACGNRTEESHNNTAGVESQETMDNPPGDASSAEALPTKETDAVTKTEKGNRVAVVYFSATGTTKGIARKIAGVLAADTFEIIPKEAYSSDDLDYNEDSCRANQEMNEESSRPGIENDLSAVKEFDRIYIGFPIWWGTAPRIIQTFLDTNDLSGKTVYLFCTSGGSGIEQSVRDLQKLYPDVKIVSGERFEAGASEDEVKDWLDELK